MANTRKIGASVGGIIILVLAIIAFAIAPMFGPESGTAPTVLGKWGNKTIDNSPTSPFIEQYGFLDNYVRRQNMYPEDNKNREYFAHQVAYIGFRSAVVQTAIEEEIKNTGFTVPDFRLNKELINYYLDEEGSYSELRYTQTSEDVKRRYINQVEKSILNIRYLEDLFGSASGYGLKTSGKEASFIQDMVKKERSFKFVSFSSGMYPASEVVAYGKEHKDLFVSYDLSLLSYPTEEEAKKMLASIKSGEPTFESAVILNTSKTLTDDNGKITSAFRTDINRYFPDNEDLKTVLELKPSDLSPVVKLYNGTFGIVRCDGEPSEPDFESENVISQITAYINRNDKGIIEDYLLKLAEKFSEDAKVKGFEKAAEEFTDTKITVNTSNSFGINYGNTNILQPLPNQGILRAITENENFFKKAFALKNGEVSAPILVGSDPVILTLNEEKDVDEYTLDSTKKAYYEQTKSWFAYYNLAMLMTIQGMTYPIPVAQKTFLDYVYKNPKFIDNFDKILN